MVNWDTFLTLPGAADVNFEMLCRALIRRHYGSFGDFFALANQPGVEFHLKLHSPCALGDVGRWYGWQCRWYELPSGRLIGNTRRKKITDAISKTEAELPNLTDWVLWTRYPLTPSDQKWFYGLKTHMRLHLWNAVEVEEHLSGPAEIFRGTYFGELVLTPALLNEMHVLAVAPVKQRWQPEVHQVVDVERILRSALGEVLAWDDLRILAKVLEYGAGSVASKTPELPVDLKNKVAALALTADIQVDSLIQAQSALDRGDYEVLCQYLTKRVVSGRGWNELLRRLRSGRHPVALPATNLIADLHAADKTLNSLKNALTWRLVAVIADAGCGKTELSAQLTASTDDRSAGILLHGKDLHAGNSLDDLARKIVIHGKPVVSFEALAAAVDAAGQRAGRRLPIVIDGLNEAEDPRNWKALLSSLAITLQRYSFVLVVCTLRSAFATDSLPNDIPQLKIPDFEADTIEAIRRYFDYYLIDSTDAKVPVELLRHPLTLRMFCEVTNPKRETIVGVEAMPTSLTALFDRYLEQVAERITQLAPRTYRYYVSDIRTALNEVGILMWEANARSLDIVELRRSLGDDKRSWNESIVQALEHDGVLLRVADDRPSAGRISILYDALAGHILADALLERFGGRNFETWLRDPKVIASLTGDYSERHPFATDIFNAFVGLVPRRMYRRQLWPLLEEPMRTDALYQAARLEEAYLDRETVTQLAALIATSPSRGRELFYRLQITRAAISHPLNADFLDATLRSLSNAKRDLHWTEWLRYYHKEVIEDIEDLEQDWQTDQSLGLQDRLRARWVMWTLTSTVHLLRDHATRALYWFGCSEPDLLFDLTLDSLSINDPYIPERMLAACYGVAMSLWADPTGIKLRAALPVFASTLVEEMFVPGAPHSTRHVLMRDYALGIISLASKVKPACIPNDKLLYLTPPFDHLPTPFRPATKINDSDVAESENAMHMDFENYTLGGLIPDRYNYDFNNTTYRDVRRQIELRIVELGYLSTQFAAIDKSISEENWRAESRGASKTDRYGKKYSWIAYFEMYGIRQDIGALSEWQTSGRTSDADIDPSFPEPARIWMPPLPDLFTETPTKPRAWLSEGPTPDYNHLLYIDEVDGQQGPWVLINGFIEQSSENDERRVFSFLRGLLVKHKQVTKIFTAFDSLPYPGNQVIPEPQDEHFIYAGEIPWSPLFGNSLRSSNGKAKRSLQNAFSLHNGKRWLPGIPVEVPVHRFASTGDSKLNPEGGILIPAPNVCEQFKLSRFQGEWDMYDQSGGVATLYREFKAEEDVFSSKLFYMRADLMAKYTAKTKQTLVWFVWGERGFDHKTILKLRNKDKDLWAGYKFIHRHRSFWEPQP